MNKNNKTISKVSSVCQVLGGINSSLKRFTVIPDSKNNNIFDSKVVTMKRFFVKSTGLILGALLLGSNAYGGIYVSFNGGFPGSGGSANSLATIGSVDANNDYEFWGYAWCGADANVQTSGGCTLSGGATSQYASGGCGDARVNVNIVMKAGNAAGGTTRCTVSGHADNDNTSRDETRYIKLNQVVTVVNPGAHDDVDADYWVYANTKTTDGAASALTSSNTLSFTVTTPLICSKVSTDINAVLIHHVPGASGTCSVYATASGDTNFAGPVNSSTVSWQVVNTQYPKLAFVTPLSQGLTPNFIFSSSQLSLTAIVIGGSCGPAPVSQNAVVGNNAFALKQLVLGQDYSDCYIRVTNAEGLYADLAIPAFTVTENISGPGGVGGVDGSSATELWLNGSNLPGSGSISTWIDQSGKKNHFSGGIAPTVTTLNGFYAASFSNAANTHLNHADPLLSRSVFTVYNDTSTLGAVTFLANDNYWWHGAANDTALFDTNAHANVRGGSNGINGNYYTATMGPARPDAASVMSFILTGVPSPNSLGGNSNWRLGADRDCCTGRSINGAMAEMIMYTTAVNNAQRTIIENYLSTKYNIALAVGVQVYTLGAGYGGTTYKYEMAGIGQAADGSNHLNAKSSLISMTNPSGMINSEYVMWAHDNASASFQATDVPVGVSQRIGRKWRVRNSGISGVDLKFHVSELPGFSTMCFDKNNVRLLVDSDGAFNAGATVQSGAYNAKTQTITFANVSITDGYFISIGVGGSAGTTYVTTKGAGTKDGSNWLNACTFDGALNSPRLAGDIVKLARGVYKPTATIFIKAGITVIGGYEGVLTTEASDPENYETIISGDLDSNDESLGNIIMYHRDIKGTNLTRLFNITNVPNPVTLQGFYVTGMSQGTLHDHGSVVWQENSTVNYTKMKIFGNRAQELGGALLVYNSSTANITDSIFLGNVGEEGGAIWVGTNSTANVTNSQFTNNQSLFLGNRGTSNKFRGGAIAVDYASTLDIKTSTFIGNNTLNSNNGLGVTGTGGAITLDGEGTGGSKLIIADSSFSFNSARDGGGAIHAWPTFLSMNITNTDFSFNTAVRGSGGSYPASGGAIHAEGSATATQGVVNITDCEFEKNNAKDLGGAIFFTGNGVDNYITSNIKRSTFISNSAGWGGAVFAWQFGAGTLNSNNIENSTFTANLATIDYAGAIAAVNGTNMTVNHSTLYANMATGNGGGIKVRDAGTDVIVKNSLLVDNLASGGAILGNTGTVGLPFTSLAEARWWVQSGSGAAGVYNFNIGGNTFSTYVDGNGYVLVAGTNGTLVVNAPLTATTALTAPTVADKILTPAVLAVLDINELRITATTVKVAPAANVDVTSTNATNIARLKANQTLGNNFDLTNTTNAVVWAGTAQAGSFTNATCSDWGLPNGTSLSSNILGHCGNGTNGFHWQPYRAVETVTWANQAAGDIINLWVRSGSFGRGNNIENSVAITATGFNLIGFNGKSGWQNIGTQDQNPTALVPANSFVSPATLIGNIINTTLDVNGGSTRSFSLSSNGGSGSSAYNKVTAGCLPADQRGQSRTLTAKCDIGSYEAIKTDTDGDGLVDGVDNCPLLSNVAQTNTDGDNMGDLCDPDKDNDGVLNANDFYELTSLGGRLDTDHDGIPDTCDAGCASATPVAMVSDTDDDGDSITDGSDNCPTASNSTQSNADADAYGDACDADIDGDGVLNIADNCPTVSNALQIDSDGNGLGDDCNALFVKTLSSGLGDCSTWGNACAGGSNAEFQAAIDSAFAKNATLIYIAKGVYRPSATVNLKKGLQIYGGFSGTDELYYYQADPVHNLTIITGDKDSNDTVDSNGITQLTTNQVGTNLVQILNADGLTTTSEATVSLTGVNLTGAASNSALHVKDSRVRIAEVNFYGNKAVNGGGLFMESNAFAVVSDSIFAGNLSTGDVSAPFDGGGAAYVSGTGSELTLTNTQFTNNKSTFAGGALSVVSNAKATLRDCLLQSNQAVDSGGAIYANGSSAFYVVGSTFSGNSTATAAVDTGGGAIRLSSAFQTAYIGTSDFIGNTSALEGGAIHISSSAVSAVTIEDSLFKTNTSTGAGGAIGVGNAAGQATVTASRNSFISNTGTSGGAIRLAGAVGNQLVLDNSTFYDNRSSANGGAINLDLGADAVMSHVTVLQNIATGNGGGIRVDNAGSLLNIKNSLLVGNTSSGSSGGNNISISSGGYTDSGYNLIGYGAASGLFTGGLSNVTPTLPSKKAVAATIDSIITPALTDYSGLHKSIALTATSEARDVIPNGTNGCVTSAGYDERGFDRPDMVDVTDPEQKNDVRKCDIGAFEFNNAYRVDCYAEDGLRPDQGSGYGYYYCPDGTTPSAGELANNVFVGRVDYFMLFLLSMLGVARMRKQQYKRKICR